jgi:hypothetical protein
MRHLRGRWAALLASALLLAACESELPGDPDAAARAARDFLETLSANRADEAWHALTPATREAAYLGDQDLFADELAAADWSAIEWEVGMRPVSLETTWAVYVSVEGGSEAVTQFLVHRGIFAPWREGQGEGVLDRGIFFYVQLADSGVYVIPGISLDTAQ